MNSHEQSREQSIIDSFDGKWPEMAMNRSTLSFVLYISISLKCSFFML